ncbi:MAG: hypothetical protein ACFCBW_07015 [Candidatus Competibacterales bacterium]
MPHPSQEDPIERINAPLTPLYESLVDDEDARVCTDIDEAACRVVPANFFLLTLANIASKWGDELSNPKTVLTWLMGVVQAPPGLVAWLVPIRESGALLPQLFFAQMVRRRPVRKGLWVLGSIVQGFAIVAMGGWPWWRRESRRGSAF